MFPNSLQYFYFHQDAFHFNKMLFDITYFLKYKLALGCADPPVAEGTITKRVADVVNVGCHPDELMWQMTCINNQWTGLYENCSTG